MKIVMDGARSPRDRRIADELRRDEAVVLVKDPRDDRTLLVLSVDEQGRAVVEYEPENLAPGIRLLNEMISQRGQTARAAA